MTTRRLLSEDEFDQQLRYGSDPIAKVPAGFPSMHARYPSIASRGFTVGAFSSGDVSDEAVEGDADVMESVRQQLADVLDLDKDVPASAAGEPMRNHS
jgi:hypothetical protein